jgi:hypothetical protein
MADLAHTAAERKAALQAAAPPPAPPSQSAVHATHFWRVICAWACSTDLQSDLTRQSSISVPAIGLVDEAVIVGWETDLHAQHFVTAREGRTFTVSLP